MSAAPPRLGVDGVLCISLRDRADRRQALVREFAPLGLDIEFVLVERDPENPERGCYTSHQACARLALARGYERVLILEDDATLEAFEPQQVANINRFLRLRRPPLFYLGGILGRMWRIPFPNIVRCRMAGCHAYILSAAGCRRALATPFAGEPIDSVYPKRFRAYGAYPMLCQQQPECRVRSDLAGPRAQRLGDQAQVKDAEFWRRNRARQHVSVRKNLGRTLLLRWL